MGIKAERIGRGHSPWKKKKKKKKKKKRRRRKNERKRESQLRATLLNVHAMF